MDKEEINIDGSKIVDAYTKGSMFDMNCIWCKDDQGRTMLLNASEFMKLMSSEVKFKATRTKKHFHLKITEVNGVKI